MERRKKLNFWNEGSGFKFVSIKSKIVNDRTNANYDGGNETISNTEVLRSIFLDYKDAYILLRGYITTAGWYLMTNVVFKNYAPCIKCISKLMGQQKIMLKT